LYYVRIKDCLNYKNSSARVLLGIRVKINQILFTKA
jgi:hypothetical protein